MMKKLFLFTFSLCPSLLLLMIMTVHELSLKRAGVCLNSKLLSTIIRYRLKFWMKSCGVERTTLHGFEYLRVTMRSGAIYSAWI